MPSPIRTLKELARLYRKGFRPVEFVRDDNRISLHPSGWRVNGSGRFKSVDDAIEYLESAKPERWRQIYCGMTPFLVSDKGNVKHVDGSAVKMNLANGRYQIMYKPEDPRGRGRDGRIHKKRVYRSMLVAMAWLDFRKGDAEHEIHHINGYRTDDRVANLMIVDHDEHMRIHSLGPCGLSGMPDERIMEAPAGCEPGAEEPETYAGSHVALKPAHDGNATNAAPKKKRRRGKRGGKKNNTQGATQPDQQDKRETEEAKREQQSEQGAARRQDGDENRTAMKANAAQCAETNPAPQAQEPSDAKKRTSRRHNGGETTTPAKDLPRRADDAATTAKEADGPPQADADRKPEPQKESDAAQPDQAASEEARRSSNAVVEPQEKNAPEKRTARAKKAQRNGDTAKNAQATNWKAARTALSDEIERFLDAAGARDAATHVDEKEISKAAKPVYKALKPFAACPDAIERFDAGLACIRAITLAYNEAGTTAPAPVHSMLGTIHQSVVKDAVKRISAEGDDLERACLRELLCDEAAKPLYKKTPHARKFRQCVSIIDSRNEKAPEND
ncbi:MAG: HNH endonuclease [Slackia sp.]|nr:HNH endonuclease [Slackia sp.]